MLRLHKPCLALRYYEHEFAVEPEHGPPSTRVRFTVPPQESNKGRWPIASAAIFLSQLFSGSNNSILSLSRPPHHWSIKLKFRLRKEHSSRLHPRWTNFTLSPAYQNQFNSKFKKELFKVLVWKDYSNGCEPTSTHVHYS